MLPLHSIYPRLALLSAVFGAASTTYSAPLSVDGETVIPAVNALKRLRSLQGKTVRLVLKTADGVICPLFARVKFADNYRVVLDRHIRTLPGNHRSLMTSYLAQRSDRSTPRSSEERKPIQTCHVVSELVLDAKTLRYGPRQYVVLDVVPIDLGVPEVSSALSYRALKLDPDTEPWQSKTGGGPSNWVIRYGPPDQPQRFEFRLPNPFHFPHPRIDSVIMHDEPEWWYDGIRREYFPAVVFTVRHIGQQPRHGYFELDTEGYPRNGQYRLHRILTPKTQQEIMTLRESALASHQTSTGAKLERKLGPSSQTPERKLRYRYQKGNQYRVSTEKTSTISGLVNGAAVSVRKLISEFVTISIASVDSTGIATVDATPTRYVASVTIESGGEKIQSETFDTASENTPVSPVLKHLQLQLRLHIGRSLTCTLSRQGSIQIENRLEAGDDFLLFRSRCCGFSTQWLPPLPAESIAVDGGWTEQFRLAGAQNIEASWWAVIDSPESAKTQLMFRGEGMITSGLRDSAPAPTAFRSTLRLSNDELLPTSFALVVDNAPLPHRSRISNTTHRTVEKVSWERISHLSTESDLQTSIRRTTTTDTLARSAGRR